MLAPGCCECHRDDPVEGWAAGAGNDRFASGRSDEPLDGAPPQSPQGTLAIDCALGTPAEGYAERVPRPFLLCGLRCGTRLGADPTQRAERRVRAELSAAREQFGGQHPLCIFYIAAWLKRQERPSQPAGSVASMAGLHQQLGALLGKEVKKIRVTGEVPPRISTIDVVVAITGQTATNAGHYLDRLKANYPEVSSTSTNYCCPRRGRRKLISKPGNEFAPPGARCPKVSSTRTNYHVFRQMSSERRRPAACSFICAPGPFSRVPETSAPRLVQPALTIFPGKGQRRPPLTAQRFSSLGAAICIPGASGPRLVQVALTILHGRGQRKPELTP